MGHVGHEVRLAAGCGFGLIASPFQLFRHADGVRHIAHHRQNAAGLAGLVIEGRGHALHPEPLPGAGAGAEGFDRLSVRLLSSQHAAAVRLGYFGLVWMREVRHRTADQVFGAVAEQGHAGRGVANDLVDIVLNDQVATVLGQKVVGGFTGPQLGEHFFGADPGVFSQVHRLFLGGEGARQPRPNGCGVEKLADQIKGGGRPDKERHQGRVERCKIGWAVEQVVVAEVVKAYRRQNQ